MRVPETHFGIIADKISKTLPDGTMQLVVKRMEMLCWLVFMTNQ